MWVQILIKRGVESSSTNQKGIFGICAELGLLAQKMGYREQTPYQKPTYVKGSLVIE